MCILREATIVSSTLAPYSSTFFMKLRTTDMECSRPFKIRVSIIKLRYENQPLGCRPLNVNDVSIPQL